VTSVSRPPHQYDWIQKLTARVGISVDSPTTPVLFPDRTSGQGTAASTESTIADMEGFKVTLRKHTLITRLPLPRLMFAGLVAAMLAGCGSGSMNNTGFTGTVGQGSIIGTTGGGSALCASTSLAAADLSGQCRAAPQATPGALEASGSSASALVAGSTISQSFVVSWRPAPEPVAGYIVYYGSTADSATVLLSDLAAGSYDPTAPSVSYDPTRDLGVSAGSSVCFRIFAYDASRTLSNTSQLECLTA